MEGSGIAKLRTTIVASVLFGLLAVSTAAVAAQTDEAGVFVWDIVDASDAGLTIEASDPRASGRLTWAHDRSLYTGGSGYALGLTEGTARLDTKDGVWTGISANVNAERFLAPQVDRGVGLIELTGADGFGGMRLTLVSIGTEGDEDPERWGYIYASDAATPVE